MPAEDTPSYERHPEERTGEPYIYHSVDPTNPSPNPGGPSPMPGGPNPVSEPGISRPEIHHVPVEDPSPNPGGPDPAPGGPNPVE